MSGYWEQLERPGPGSVHVDGSELRPGSRVRLAPRAGGDVFDLALAGRTAVVEAIETDYEGAVMLAVVVEDDPGADLGFARQPGHRFFFSPAEVEPLGDRIAGVAPARILVAGVGNVFLGDDGFGVALADRLSRLALPAGVEVVDFGIRGIDLAFAICEGYDAVVLLDATPRGRPAGTLYVIEVHRDEGQPELDAHAMDPVKVIALARTFGGAPPRMFVIGCEPHALELPGTLSEPVRASLDEAARMVQSLLAELGIKQHQEPAQ
ncbi:MAG: hydrogenase maturation protease [Solirubrobacteraceae bacterium]|jgi:hydrogenase maturation protease